MSKYRVQVLAFFESNAVSIKKRVGRQAPPFALIPDPQREVYQKYGVESSLYGFLRGSLNLNKLLKAALRGHLPRKWKGTFCFCQPIFELDRTWT